MFLVGLTGSIGMGKSTTAQIFRDLGVPVHDSDAAVHEIYRTTACDPIRSLFPADVDRHGVDRTALLLTVLLQARWAASRTRWPACVSGTTVSARLRTSSPIARAAAARSLWAWHQATTCQNNAWRNRARARW
jgi:hypothetical protein